MAGRCEVWGAGADASDAGASTDSRPAEAGDGGARSDADEGCGSDPGVGPPCCAGKPCAGECVDDPDGGPRCDCYGIVGGCDWSLGEGCCTKTHGCENTLTCSP